MGSFKLQPLLFSCCVLLSYICTQLVLDVYTIHLLCHDHRVED